MTRWSRPRTFVLGVCTVMLALARPGPTGLRAQGSSPPKAQQGQKSPTTATPSMRTTTRLVQVSVVAHDGHGKPVEDLTASDFRVFDNGQEVKVDFFEKDVAGVQPPAQEPNPAGGPRSWSNRGGRAGTPVNLTILLYDALNTKRPDQGRAKNEIVKFLGQLNPSDRIALYTLGENLHILHDFTSDTEALLQALGRYRGYNGSQGVETQKAVPNDDLAQNNEELDFNTAAEEAIEQLKTVNRVVRTTDALEAIATHVASLPGRKSLVWVSGSFPLLMGYDRDQTDSRSWGLDQQEFTEQVERATRALNDANVAVYPVDPAGLAFNNQALTQRQPTSLNPRIAGQAPVNTDPNVNEKVTMEEFAAATGGLAFHDTNDISGAMRTVMDDSRLVYTLAYTPTHGEWNNEFRKIKVEVKRSGVKLRYRSGYVATPYTPMNATQKNHVLAEAQWSPIQATEIGLSLQAEPATAAGGKPGIRFAIIADPAELRFTDLEGRHAADLVVTLAQKAADGHLVFEETKTLTLRLRDDPYKAVMARGLRLTGSQAVDPAAIEFRVVILDMSTGRLGSLQVPMAKLGVAMPPPTASSRTGPVKPQR